MTNGITCPECGAPMELAYVHRHGRWSYRCTRHPVCRLTHGAHHDGRPMGVPATHRTNRFRRLAHAALDRLWRDEQVISRDGAYRWLADKLGLAVSNCHIAAFDEELCRKTIAACESFSLEEAALHERVAVRRRERLIRKHRSQRRVAASQRASRYGTPNHRRRRIAS